MNLKEDINHNVRAIKAFIGKSDDVIFFSFKSCGKDAVAVYVDSITDKDMLGLEVISPLKNAEEFSTVKSLAKKITLANITLKNNIKDCVTAILNGSTVIFFDEKQQAIAADLKKFEMRAISEAPTGLAIRGPRNAFTETIKTNLSLIRRYLKSEELTITSMEIGTYTKTSVSLVYISGIAGKDLVDKVNDKLKSIVIDGVPDSSYIAKFLSEKKHSLFKQVGATERPDVVIERLLEGRVAVIVDGSPFVLTLPYLIIEDFQSAEDYYISSYRANFSRIIRVVALFIAVVLPAYFVSTQIFHMQLIPLNFLLTIINAIKGIPLTPSMEMFFTMLIFEILNETSVRMPKYVGMALGIVGALVLGETVVQAGIVSTPAVLIMALSGICIYTVPEITESTSILRILFLLLAGSIGIYGILVISAIMICYLVTSDNYGVPYTAPYSPLIANDLQDSFLMKNVVDMTKRPESIGSPNKIRRKRKNA
ncbi:MAG: spore germination protein [Clostridia bacterium]|nr:spore germination protein [Clostridia bacterium]